MEELRSLVADNWQNTHPLCFSTPEHGLPATKSACSKCWSSLNRKAGYDTTSTKRLPDCLDVWSMKRIKEQRCEYAVKFLLYYDVGAWRRLNQQKTSLHRTHWFLAGHSIASLKSSLTMKKIADGFCRIRKKWNHKVISAEGLLRPLPASMSWRWKFQSTSEIRWRLWRWWKSCILVKKHCALQAQWSGKSSMHLLSAGVSAKLFQKHLCLCPQIRRKLQWCSLWPVLWAGSVEAYIRWWNSSSRMASHNLGFENIDRLNKGSSNT